MSFSLFLSRRLYFVSLFVISIYFWFFRRKFKVIWLHLNNLLTIFHSQIHTIVNLLFALFVSSTLCVHLHFNFYSFLMKKIRNLSPFFLFRKKVMSSQSFFVSFLVTKFVFKQTNCCQKFLIQLFARKERVKSLLVARPSFERNFLSHSNAEVIF